MITRFSCFVSGLLMIAAAVGAEVAPPLQVGTYHIANLRLTSGVVLPAATQEYATLGEPRLNAQGGVTNAVLFCHGFGLNCRTVVPYQRALFALGGPFDPARWFLIVPTALGTPGSEAPSNSGRGARFPDYTVADMVEAQRRLLHEHFKIHHLAGVAGASMGGMQALEWAASHAGEMDWIVPMATGTMAGASAAILQLAIRRVTDDPAWASGSYVTQPREALGRSFQLFSLFIWSDAYYREHAPNAEGAREWLEQTARGFGGTDANDWIWRCRAVAGFEIAGRLAGIRARTLIVGIETDPVFPPDVERRLAAAIPGAQVTIITSPLGHVGCGPDIGLAAPAIMKFVAGDLTAPPSSPAP